MTRMQEPEWDDDTRSLVLAGDAVDLCPSCGGPAALCQDQDRQFDWRVLPPVRCHRTTALLRAQQGVTEETNPQHQALLWSVVLNEEAAGD